MTATVMTSAKTGRSKGIVIDRKTRSSPAPSMRAAS